MPNQDQSDACNNQNIENILEQYDGYILSLAQQMIPDIVPLDRRSLEIDEIAQSTRVKLFLALSAPDHVVSNLKAYIRSILYHESINVVRRYQRCTSLQLDEYGEILQGEIIASSQQMQDPAFEVERKEEIEECAAALVEDILTLPTRQRYAVILRLRDMITDIQPLETAFLNIGLDLDTIHLSDEAKEIHRLRVLLYLARKRLRMQREKKMPDHR
jgi:RNA polymerase sigma factor (sigma-70 family)